MDGAPRARYFRRRLQFAVRVRSGCIRYEQTESSGTFLRGDGEQCFGCVCMCTCVRTGSRGEARERRWQTATDIASLAAAAATAATKTTTDSCWIIRDEREHRRRNYDDAGIQRRQEYTKSASSPELSLRVREREREESAPPPPVIARVCCTPAAPSLPLLLLFLLVVVDTRSRTVSDSILLLLTRSFVRSLLAHSLTQQEPLKSYVQRVQTTLICGFSLSLSSVIFRAGFSSTKISRSRAPSFPDASLFLSVSLLFLPLKIPASVCMYIPSD